MHVYLHMYTSDIEYTRVDHIIIYTHIYIYMCTNHQYIYI